MGLRERAGIEDTGGWSDAQSGAFARVNSDWRHIHALKSLFVSLPRRAVLPSTVWQCFRAHAKKVGLPNGASAWANAAGPWHRHLACGADGHPAGLFWTMQAGRPQAPSGDGCATICRPQGFSETVALMFPRGLDLKFVFFRAWPCVVCRSHKRSRRHIGIASVSLLTVYL